MSRSLRHTPCLRGVACSQAHDSAIAPALRQCVLWREFNRGHCTLGLCLYGGGLCPAAAETRAATARGKRCSPDTVLSTCPHAAWLRRVALGETCEAVARTGALVRRGLTGVAAAARRQLELHDALVTGRPTAARSLTHTAAVPPGTAKALTAYVMSDSSQSIVAMAAGWSCARRWESSREQIAAAQARRENARLLAGRIVR